MGLDMYLTGEKYLAENFDHPEKNVMEDGFRVKSRRLELGYWRKHPNLHGFIVQNFASGQDKCQEIYLTAIDLNRIIKAVKERKLPHTTGFFFGVSPGSDEEMENDLRILEAAQTWILDRPPEQEGDNRVFQESRLVIYQASW